MAWQWRTECRRHRYDTDVQSQCAQKTFTFAYLNPFLHLYRFWLRLAAERKAMRTQQNWNNYMHKKWTRMQTTTNRETWNGNWDAPSLTECAAKSDWNGLHVRHIGRCHGMLDGAIVVGVSYSHLLRNWMNPLQLLANDHIGVLCPKRVDEINTWLYQYAGSIDRNKVSGQTPVKFINETRSSCSNALSKPMCLCTV